MSDESLEVTEAPEVEVKTESESVEDVKQNDEQPESVEGNTKDDEPSEKQEISEIEKLEHGFQKTIRRKTRQLRQAEERALELERQLAELQPKQEDNAPKEDDFDNFDDYVNAKVEYEAEKRAKDQLRQAKEQEALKARQEARAQAAKRFAENEARFRQEHPDYDKNAEAFLEIADDLKRVKGQNNPTLTAMGQVLSELPDAPALINHLAQNEELAYELADKSPVNAAFELFKLAQSLTAETKQINVKPDPVKPVKANGKIDAKPLDLSSDKFKEKYGL